MKDIREVSELYIYPVKSCRGIKVESWKINEYGFKYDRFWMLVDDQNRCLTQREHPKLALITATIQENVHRGGVLVLKNPENDQELILPLSPNNENRSKLSVGHTVCDKIAVYDCGEGPSKWVSDFLGFKVKIVYKSIDDSRFVEKNLPSKDDLTRKPETAFADGYPFLILSQESLSDLNKRLSSPVAMRNFRPNIVIKGCKKPYEEDTWKQIRIGPDHSNDHLFFLVARCTRCVMTTVNPETGVKEGLEPLKTLQKYRRVDPGAKYHACFGMNAIHNETDITLNVGDQVRIIATGEHIREK